MELKDRLIQLRKQLNLTQEEFGKRISTARNTIANYEIGMRTPREQTLFSICREFGVEYIWLKEGVGEMFTTRDDDILDLIDRILDGENETAKAVFKALAALDDSDWKVLQKIIDSLQKK